MACSIRLQAVALRAAAGLALRSARAPEEAAAEIASKTSTTEISSAAAREPIAPARAPPGDDHPRVAEGREGVGEELAREVVFVGDHVDLGSFRLRPGEREERTERVVEPSRDDHPGE